MSFGAGGGSQGTIRYGLVFDTKQAEQAIGTFKGSLTSITAPTQQATKAVSDYANAAKGIAGPTQQMTVATQQATKAFIDEGTAIKAITAPTQQATQNMQKMVGTQGPLAAGFAKTTGAAKDMVAQTSKIGSEIQRSGVGVKEMAGSLGRLGIGVSATATSIIGLAAGFRDYNDAQIAVDRANRRLSTNQEAAAKAQEKLDALVAKGITSGKEYAQAQLDVTQANEAVRIQTELVGEAEERRADSQSYFAATIIPTVIGATATLASGFSELKTISGGLKDGIGKLSGSIGRAGLAGTMVTLAGPLAGIFIGFTVGDAIMKKSGEQFDAYTKKFGENVSKLNGFDQLRLSIMSLWDPEAKKQLETLNKQIAAAQKLHDELQKVDPKSLTEIMTMSKEDFSAYIDLIETESPKLAKSLKEAFESGGEGAAEAKPKIDELTESIEKNAAAIKAIPPPMDAINERFKKVTTDSQGATLSINKLYEKFKQGEPFVSNLTDAFHRWQETGVNPLAESLPGVNRALEYQQQNLDDVGSSADEVAEGYDEIDDRIGKLIPGLEEVVQPIRDQHAALMEAEGAWDHYGTAAFEADKALQQHIFTMIRVGQIFEYSQKNQLLYNDAQIKGKEQARDFFTELKLGQIQASQYRKNIIETSQGTLQFADTSRMLTSEIETLIQRALIPAADANVLLQREMEGARDSTLGFFDSLIGAETGKDFSAAWKELDLGSIPKNLKDDFKDMAEAFREPTERGREVATALELISLNAMGLGENLSEAEIGKTFQEISKDFKEFAATDVEAATLLKDIPTIFDDIAKGGEKMKMTQIALTEAMKDGNITTEELNKIIEEYNKATGNAVKPTEDLSEAQTKIAENNILARTINQVNTNMGSLTETTNLQGRAVRGLTKDFGGLVAIMKEMQAVKTGGDGGNGDGFQRISTNIPEELIESPQDKAARLRELNAIREARGLEKLKEFPVPTAQLDITEATKNITRLMDNYAGYIKFVNIHEPMARLNIQGATKSITRLIDNFAGYLVDVSSNEPMARINITGATKKITKLIDNFWGYVKTVNIHEPMIRINNKEALSKISAVKSALKNIPDETVNVNVYRVNKAQHGYHGTVSGPTMFMAGEAGAERVDISPNRTEPHTRPTVEVGGRGTIVVNLTNILSDREMVRTYRRELGKDLYRFGPT